jgi:two-component system, NarL family, nitrate/nitrite response regulator NarL
MDSGASAFRGPVPLQIAERSHFVLRIAGEFADVYVRDVVMRNRLPAAVAEKIRIAVIEEQELYRQGLCLLLSQQSDLEVIGDAAAWPDALALVKREQPDVVLLAIGPSNSTDIDCLPQLFASSEETKVLVLSDSMDQDLPPRAVRLGAAGVFFKNKRAEMLLKAIECVNAGEAWLDRTTTANLLRELSPRNRPVKKDPEEKKIASLSQREREVIKLVGQGLKNKQIAEKLFISDITVHHHLTSIYSKLEVTDRLELLIYAYRYSLAELPQ